MCDLSTDSRDLRQGLQAISRDIPGDGRGQLHGRYSQVCRELKEGLLSPALFSSSHLVKQPVLSSHIAYPCPLLSPCLPAVLTLPTVHSYDWLLLLKSQQEACRNLVFLQEVQKILKLGQEGSQGGQGGAF